MRRCVGRAGSDVDPLAAAVSSCAACVGGSERSGLASALAVRPQVASAGQPAANYAAVR